jgi:hypothetical protein
MNTLEFYEHEVFIYSKFIDYLSATNKSTTNLKNKVKENSYSYVF